MVLFPLPTRWKRSLPFLLGSTALCWIFYITLYSQNQSYDLQYITSKFTGSTQTQVVAPEPAPLHPDDPKILLVSAIYPVSKFKHPDPRTYETYLKNYLGKITTDMYLYVAPSMEPLVRSLLPSTKGDFKVTLNTTYATPFAIPPLRSWEARYTRMRKNDRAPAKGKPEMYALSNARVFFLDRAVKFLRSQAKSREYDYAFWVDPASFHTSEHAYRRWPDPKRVREVWKEGQRASGGDAGRAEDELLFFPMWEPPHPSMKFWTENMGPIDNKFSQGHFFGGPPKAIDWLAKTFYSYHDHYIVSRFVGKEQALFNSLILLFRDRFITVWYNDPDAPLRIPPAQKQKSGAQSLALGYCNSDFFYYQYFLAAPEARVAMADLWIKAREGWWGSLTAWFTGSGKKAEEREKEKEEAKCRLTRTLGMGGVLETRFGKGWGVGPSGQIKVLEELVWDL